MSHEPLTITAAAPLLRQGQLTPSELLEQCLHRVDIYDPQVRAWVHLDRERARRDAQRLTDELKAGRYRGPLHGIPIGIKDIIDVFDMPTACGSAMWKNSIARQDATVVAKLREAGAIILGKTVTTSYAFLDPSMTRNPWNRNRTPGGSSSGSAAAVACGMCLGALGSQTGGSLTRPASFCGVCSLKPSHGSVSVEGVLPLAPSLDHIGVMANCVQDLALLSDCVFEPEVRARLAPLRIDERNSPITVNTTTDFGLYGLDKEMLSALSGFIKEIGTRASDDSCRVKFGPISLPYGFTDVPHHHGIIMAVEAAAVHADRIARHPQDYPPKITELIQRGQKTSAIDFTTAQRFQKRMSAEIRDNFQFLLQPAALGVAPGLETTGNAMMNSPWSFTGLPTVSFPIAWSDGLPLSAQIVARKHNEPELLRVAAWCELLLNLPHPLPPESA